MRPTADRINATAQILTAMGGLALLSWLYLGAKMPSIPIFVAGLLLALLPAAAAVRWGKTR